MGKMETLVHEQDRDALEWASRYVVTDLVESVSARPWARTYRLRSSQGGVYLKVLPRDQGRAVASFARLAELCPNEVPSLMAFDHRRAWLLTRDHGGRRLGYDSPAADVLLLARTYGLLQARLAKTPDMVTALERPDFSALLGELMAFLGHSKKAVGKKAGLADAEYFLGEDRVAELSRLVRLRLPLLRGFLASAGGLPVTVNHGDLRPPNAGITSDGQCVIVDWDDMIAGPAGMSLHGLFEGCSTPIILLSGSRTAKKARNSPNGQLLSAYIDALVEGGYADRATIERCLPGSMCAGMIQFILNFARFPGDDAKDAVADTLEERFDDLLDVCDLLAKRSDTALLKFAKDYEAHGHTAKAQSLLADHLARHPDDVEVLVWSARVDRKEGDTAGAIKSLQRAVRLESQRAELHAELAQAQLEKLNLQRSRTAATRALELDSNQRLAESVLGRVDAIDSMVRVAARPAEMPRIMHATADMRRMIQRPELIRLAADMFERYGTLQIDNAFPVEFIRGLHEAFLSRYAPYFREANHPDALYLGDRRYMLTVDIEPPFDNPNLLGAPMVLPVVRKLLGDDTVLGAFTAVVSLPGSKDQGLHKDHTALFPNTPWHHTLPAFAAQIIIPLVPLNEMTGTTRFHKGSHRIHSETAANLPSQDPVVPLGSCLLHDYRCMHQGVGNRSDIVRPMLTLIFNRRWFRDHKNYGKQPPLRLTEEAYGRLPDDLLPLFEVWDEERKHLGLMRSLLRK